MLQRLTRRQQGLVLALITACVSGFAVFFNGYGVRAWTEVADPTTYTTLKNALSAAIIAVIAVSVLSRRRRVEPGLPAAKAPRLLWLVPLIGGSIPFVLFFEGLAQAQSAQAAFIHKTLLIWVAAIAVVFLRERLSWPHYLAIAFLIGGQLALVGGPAELGLGAGEAMIVAATLLWSIEVVVSKKVLTSVRPIRVSVVRMVGGSVVLGLYTLLRSPEIAWQALTVDHLVWLSVAGVFLSAYVLSWHAALERAPAVDVTAVLVLGAVVTGLLQSGVRGVVFPDPLGMTLILTGAVVIFIFAFRRAADRR